MRDPEPIQQPGIFYRPDPAPDGSRVACGFNRRGVEVARFIVPDGAPTNVVRFHLQALLNLHDPQLRMIEGGGLEPVEATESPSLLRVK